MEEKMSTHISTEMIRLAYIISKKVYNKELKTKDGLSELVEKYHWNRYYANIHIHNFKAMVTKEGVIRNMSEYAINYFLYYILNDFGNDYLKNALFVIENYIDTYSKNKSNIGSIIKIHKIYSNILNENIKICEEQKTKKYTENNIVQIMVKRHERNKMAREKCIEYYGYKCFICEKTLTEIYGDIAENFIHVHHVNEIATIQEKYEIDPINDLRPLCPNCHAILHRKSPPYEINEIKKVIIL
jgi:5-methylcytosine-specific restriction protein A